MNFNIKLIIAGFALILFGILAALNATVYYSLTELSMIAGVLGLILILIGCIGKQEPVRNADKEKENDDPDTRDHSDR